LQHVARMPKSTKTKRLRDSYRFPGFHPALNVVGLFGDHHARVIRLTRRSKKPCAGCAIAHSGGGTTANCAGSEISPLEDTKRFAFHIGRRCRNSSIQDVAKEHLLDWKTVKALEMEYMREQIKRAGHPRPKVLGIDEISIRKGHSYRIVVSDLERRRAIWFGGKDRSEESMDEFYAFLGERRTKRVRLAVMDMWKPFRNSTNKKAPQAAILFDKFHILRHLGEALDKVRKQEYARLDGQKRKFIKSQKYALLSHKENLEGTARKNLKILLAANKRLNTAYVLKESFGQLWDYKSEAWARKFFDNWRDQLKWQRLKPMRSLLK
jgi:transposase